MLTKDWITIGVSGGFSIIALVVSVITAIKTIRWNRYKHYSEQKQSIMKNFLNYGENLTINFIEPKKLNSIDELKQHIVNSSVKNHLYLSICLRELTENLLENKKIKKAIFYCQSCSKFYNAIAIKLINTMISSTWFGTPIYYLLLPQLNNPNTLSFPSLIKAWNTLYIDQFNYDVKLYYISKSYKEFLLFNNLNLKFKDWIREYERTNSFNKEFKHYETYIG